MSQINLTELDFTNIRTSLLNYLKKQDVVKDLDFEGSAVNFLLDLLAYNTLYYAHYANMIAGEAFLSTAQLEKSLISLVKPLGYTIPSRTAAVASIKLNNVLEVGPLLPYTVNVSGTTPEGIRYQFWNIDSISVENNTTENFQVYQGNYVSLSYGGDGFDFPDQKILIPDLSMDIRTLIVSVGPGGGAYKTWERYDLYSGYFVKGDTKLYTVEKEINGFSISFGGSVGQKLNAGDLVKIEYLSTSGILANNCSTFRGIDIPSGSTITTISPSRGGTNQPDLDAVRKNAPLVFSAQQRLVTTDDYKSFLTEMGVSGVKVWGGENNSPPTFGRVFYSFNPVGNAIVSNNIKKALSNRSIITVTPEFISPNNITVVYPLNIIHNSSVSAYSDLVIQKIKTNINSSFPENTFDLTFYKSKISSIINEEPGYSLNENGWFISLQKSFIPQNDTIINFKTQIKKDEIGSGLYSLDFISPLFPGKTVFLQDIPINYENASNPPKIGNIGMFSKDSGGVIENLNFKVGSVDYSTGVITLTIKVSSQTISIRVNPLNQNEFIAKDEMYLKTTIVSENITSI